MTQESPSFLLLSSPFFSSVLLQFCFATVWLMIRRCFADFFWQLSIFNCVKVSLLTHHTLCFLSLFRTLQQKNDCDPGRGQGEPCSSGRGEYLGLGGPGVGKTSWRVVERIRNVSLHGNKRGVLMNGLCKVRNLHE